MSLTPGHSWDDGVQGRLLRFGTTALIIFLLLLFNSLPLRIFDFGEIRPSFLLIAVYYWAVFRPHTLPPWGAFVSGLLVDLLGGYPLGLNAFVTVGVQMLVQGQRKVLLGQNFAVIWSAFMAIAMVAHLTVWLGYMAFHFHTIGVRPVLIAGLLTGLAYPLAALPLFMLGKKTRHHD